MNKRLTRISKYMSFILCHESASIGLKLDAEGWSNVQEFVEKANATGKSVTTEQVMAVVAENDKQRFELSEDQTRVRAVKVSRKSIRKETRQAAAKPAVPRKPKAETPQLNTPAPKPKPSAVETPAPETPAPETPAAALAKKTPSGKPVFTRSRLVQRTKTN